MYIKVKCIIHRSKPLDYWPLILHCWKLTAVYWPLTLHCWKMTAAYWHLTRHCWKLTAAYWPLTRHCWKLTAAYWPLTLQCWKMTAAYWPLTRHCWKLTAADVLVLTPLPQCKQRVRPRPGWYWPIGHDLHGFKPSNENVPASHGSKQHTAIDINTGQ